MAHNGGPEHLGQTGSRHLVSITVGSNPVEEGRYSISITRENCLVVTTVLAFYCST